MERGVAGRASRQADKRQAILGAALRRIARSGLHNTPMSAIAREAGVAAGTLYIYFRSKEELINALYLELIVDRMAAISRAVDVGLPVTEQLWRAWSTLARWHLTHPDASSFMHQCEGSAILTGETRAAQAQLEASGREEYERGVREGRIRQMPLQVFHALFSGPILELAHMRDRGQIEIDERVLRVTFEGVRRSLLASAESRAGEVVGGDADG
jgi:TetR/AcrR family transcriptional regulator, repressor of fatR-cypB operon